MWYRYLYTKNYKAVYTYHQVFCCTESVNTKQENRMVYGANFTQCICTGYCELDTLLPSFIMNSWLDLPGTYLASHYIAIWHACGKQTHFAIWYYWHNMMCSKFSSKLILIQENFVPKIYFFKSKDYIWKFSPTNIWSHMVIIRMYG